MAAVRSAVVPWLSCLAALAPVALASEPLDLNAATAAELAALEGVSGELAASIVSLRRDRGGGLASVEALHILPQADAEALQSLRAGTAVSFEVRMSPRGPLNSVAEVLARFAHEPSAQTVQRWAEEHARLQPGMVEAWMRSARAAAALPRLQVEYRVQDSYRNDFRRFDEFGNPPTDAVSRVFDVQTDANVGQTRVALARATWQLDKLVMSNEQLRVINEAQDVAKLRERVLTEVTRVYFERRRLQAEQLLHPPADLAARVHEEIRLMELSAQLDALTGGRFTQALRRGEP